MPISLLSHYADKATLNSYATPFIDIVDILPAPRWFSPRIGKRNAVYVSPFGYSYLFGYRYFVQCGSKGIFQVSERLDGVFVAFMHEFSTLQSAVDFGLSLQYAKLLGYEITAKGKYGFTL